MRWSTPKMVSKLSSHPSSDMWQSCAPQEMHRLCKLDICVESRRCLVYLVLSRYTWDFKRSFILDLGEFHPFCFLYPPHLPSSVLSYKSLSYKYKCLWTSGSSLDWFTRVYWTTFACFCECFTSYENTSNLAGNFLMCWYLQSFLLRWRRIGNCYQHPKICSVLSLSVALIYNGTDEIVLNHHI